MRALEPVAYGPLALTPATFWTLTIRELRLLVRGWRWRQDAAQEQWAWAVAHVMNASGWLKSPVTAALLLGRPTGEVWHALRAKTDPDPTD